MSTNDETCCPRFNPEPWDGKTLTWLQQAAFLLHHLPEVRQEVRQELCRAAAENRLARQPAMTPPWR